jgi:TPR repeat protein
VAKCFGDQEFHKMRNLNVADFASHRAAAQQVGSVAIARKIAAAEQDSDACFDLGVAYSTGASGVECDLVEAHMWFNLAAARGHEEAAQLRAEIADDMTAREIAEAQRRARHWLASIRRKAA